MTFLNTVLRKCKTPAWPASCGCWTAPAGGRSEDLRESRRDSQGVAAGGWIKVRAVPGVGQRGFGV